MDGLEEKTRNVYTYCAEPQDLGEIDFQYEDLPEFAKTKEE